MTHTRRGRQAREGRVTRATERTRTRATRTPSAQLDHLADRGVTPETHPGSKEIIRLQRIVETPPAPEEKEAVPYKKTQPPKGKPRKKVPDGRNTK
jgi:hypothetical protein